MNLGYIGNEIRYEDGTFVRARIYYDTNFTPVGDQQPLINNPNATGTAYCLEVVNTTGSNKRIAYTINGTVSDVSVAPGNPVTTGPGRSRTVAVLNNAGATVRGDIRDFTISEAVG